VTRRHRRRAGRPTCRGWGVRRAGRDAVRRPSDWDRGHTERCL